MRALVAEDDATCLTIVESALKESGYEVITAGDGKEAWDVLCDPHSPRLAVLDWHMPGLDGLEVCRRVRQREGGQYVYILILSVDEGDASLTKALEAGADDFVGKSVSMAELTARFLPAERFVKVCEEMLAFKESMRRQAPYDVLTGLDNRVTILDLLNKEVARAQRHEDPISLILVAVDHWASLNERYSRQVGDGVLCEVARRIVTNVRPYDLVGRYGDEEFLVVAPGCAAAGAAELSERIRMSLTGETIRVLNRLIAITASVGTADGLPKDDQDANRMLDAVAEALQRAREAGGNRVEAVAPQPAAAAGG